MTNDTLFYTESTRIQNNSAACDDTLNDDEITIVSNQNYNNNQQQPQQQHQQTRLEAESSRTSSIRRPGGGHSQKRSRQSVDLDEPPQVVGDDQSSNLIACLNDLEVDGPPVRVILAPTEFKLDEFVCYKADLQANFERLQSAIHSHYEKVSRASKSLESDDLPDTESKYLEIRI